MHNNNFLGQKMYNNNEKGLQVQQQLKIPVEYDLSRQQFIPLRLKENSISESSLDRIRKWFTEELMKNQNFLNEKSKKKIEIEARLGRYEMVNKNDTTTLPLLRKISEDNIIILNELFNGKDFRFIVDMTKDKFLSLNDYMMSLRKALKNKIKYGTGKDNIYSVIIDKFVEEGVKPLINETFNEDIILDVRINQEMRISYFMSEKKWLKIIKNKQNQRNLELIHNGECLRICACDEEESSYSLPEFCQLMENSYDSITSIRIKHRKSFRYQFMEITLTRALNLKLESEDCEGLMTLIGDGNDAIPKVNQRLCDLLVKFDFDLTYEVENEIVDMEFLHDKMKNYKAEFSSHLKKFLRNIEVMNKCKDFLQFYGKHEINKFTFKFNNMELGNYMDSEFQNNQKGLVSILENK
jgi:hypothetical protein